MPGYPQGRFGLARTSTFKMVGLSYYRFSKKELGFKKRSLDQECKVFELPAKLHVKSDASQALVT